MAVLAKEVRLHGRHYPNSDGLNEIPASEILAKIEKGEPVEYDHAIIKSDLDIDMLDQQEGNINFIIESPIKIANSQINGFVNFLGAIFKGPVDFTGTNFNAGASFI